MSGFYKPHIIIDLKSSDRDSGLIETPKFCLSHQIKFSQKPSKSYYLRLENTMIPKTFYDIDSTNNTLLTNADGDGNITSTIPEGNYTITELMAEIETQLDADTAETWTLTYDDITNKITINAVWGGSTTVSLVFDTIANGSTLNDPLGIGKTSNGLSDSSLAIPNTTDTEATYTVDLDTKSYINVETNISSANYYDKNSQKHIGAIVPITVDRNEKQYFENTDGHLTLLNNKGPLSCISFKLKDENDVAIDLNGAEWSTTFAIYELTELHKI